MITRDNVTVEYRGRHSGCSYVYLDEKYIGKVYKSCSTSGTATRWAVEGIGFVNGGYGTKAFAVSSLVHETKERAK